MNNYQHFKELTISYHNKTISIMRSFLSYLTTPYQLQIQCCVKWEMWMEETASGYGQQLRIY